MNKKRLISLLKISLIFICFDIGLAQPDLKVEGIFFEEKSESYAIVNSGIVKVGDTIEGATVVDITKDFVKFQYGNESLCKKIEEKIGKQNNNISNLDLYKSRIKEIKKLSREEEEEYEALREKQTSDRQFEEMEKSDKYSEYAKQSNTYYEAAIKYELAGKCEEAVDALEHSVHSGEQLLNTPMDDATKMNIDSILQLRKTELERTNRKCKKGYKYK